MSTLKFDPIACRAHGLCAGLLPAARRAATACLALALRLAGP